MLPKKDVIKKGCRLLLGYEGWRLIRRTSQGEQWTDKTRRGSERGKAAEHTHFQQGNVFFSEV